MKATADIAWSGPTPGKAKAGESVDVTQIPPGVLARWTVPQIDLATGEVIREAVLVEDDE